MTCTIPRPHHRSSRRAKSAAARGMNGHDIARLNFEGRVPAEPLRCTVTRELVLPRRSWFAAVQSVRLRFAAFGQ